MRKLWYFLGSAYLAALLITVAAAGVIAGTIIEARSESHALAASWIYSNRYFQGLLALFFVNILVSSLRRWPFRWKHIPFLTTHLGLLMIIGGTFIKSFWGLQGGIYLTEGGITHQLQIPASMALYVQQKDPYLEEMSPFIIGENRYHGQLPIKIKAVHPHAAEHYSSWIHGDHLYLEGLDLLPVTAWKKGLSLPSGTMVRLEKDNETRWRLMALRTDDINAAAQALYSSGKISCSTLEGACLSDTPHYGQIPTIAWLQDMQGDLCILMISEEGMVYSDLFRYGNLSSVLVYDEGFSGYAALTHLPIGQGVTLTSPLHIEQKMVPPRLKLEDNRPRLVLDIDNSAVAVVYHPRGVSLPQPAADGKYLLRLAPIKKEIPYNLRLHKATQHNYPGTGQAMHYEAKVTLEERATGQTTKAVLSMNQVLETWDGYRFYLSGMAPEGESSPKQVHIVVNHDPAKYVLTYPGGFLTVMGILMLLSPIKKFF